MWCEGQEVWAGRWSLCTKMAINSVPFMRLIIFPRRFLFAAGNKCAVEFIFEKRVSFSRAHEASNAMVLLYSGNSGRVFARRDKGGGRSKVSIYRFCQIFNTTGETTHIQEEKNIIP